MNDETAFDVNIVSNTYEKGKGVIKFDDDVYYTGQAFLDCDDLVSISLPNSVVTINKKAFNDCDALTSIMFSNNVSYVGEDAFRSSWLLSQMPNGIIYINNVLYGYKGEMPLDTDIVSKNDITCIANNAFANCKNLSSITFNEGLRSISESAFSGCIALNNVHIPTTVTNIDKNAFNSCSALTTIIIPNSVKTIMDYAFFKCENLSVSIPNSVTKIGYNAFYGVKHIEYHGTATGSPWGAKSIN